MKHDLIKKNNDLLNVAKLLRHNMTRQEKHLWYDFLKNYPIKIYKQRIIDNFIADFYCHKARLVIDTQNQAFRDGGNSVNIPRDGKASKTCYKALYRKILLL